jgi:hypothetical protein
MLARTPPDCSHRGAEAARLFWSWIAGALCIVDGGRLGVRCAYPGLGLPMK